ncbi:hypothetical protein NEFER03_1861 [Nematocida sp. LUAm3]|nr:hypothetical protein NEFER03_1861 [Nematocida sp. LUAm3]KAI5173989.1 hypothetical protein NEFER02_0456 [Nematocida sp. LUAm2]
MGNQNLSTAGKNNKAKGSGDYSGYGRNSGFFSGYFYELKEAFRVSFRSIRVISLNEDEEPASGARVFLSWIVVLLLVGGILGLFYFVYAQFLKRRRDDDYDE